MPAKMSPVVCKRVGGKWNSRTKSCRYVDLHKFPGKNKMWQVQEYIVAGGDAVDDPYSVPNSDVVLGKNKALELKKAWMAKSVIVQVDYNNLDSMKRAERQKENLEKKGYFCKKTIQAGFNRFNLVYEK